MLITLLISVTFLVGRANTLVTDNIQSDYVQIVGNQQHSGYLRFILYFGSFFKLNEICF